MLLLTVWVSSKKRKKFCFCSLIHVKNKLKFRTINRKIKYGFYKSARNKVRKDY